MIIFGTYYKEGNHEYSKENERRKGSCFGCHTSKNVKENGILMSWSAWWEYLIFDSKGAK